MLVRRIRGGRGGRGSMGKEGVLLMRMRVGEMLLLPPPSSLE